MGRQDAAQYRGRAAMSGSKLLSIDDDAQVLDLIRRIAGDMGFEVETTTSATAFKEAYARMQPNVVTVDICMPEADGVELLRWLGDAGYTHKIIILSGAHPDYAEMAKRLGTAMGKMGIDILRKPFRVRELREALSPGAASPAPGDAQTGAGTPESGSAMPAPRG